MARDLLGKLVVRTVPGGGVRWGRLVEVEAYLGPDDLAAHSARGRRTPRTRVMYGPPGRAYVYLVYGLHHCLNFVTRPEGEPQAVLVRALAPGEGLAGSTSGPGLACRALGVGLADNGLPLEPPGLYVADDGYRPAPGDVFATPRIGVDYAEEWAAAPYRFCLDSPYVSRALASGRARARRAAAPPTPPAEGRTRR